MKENSSHHSQSNSQSTAYSDDVDSAATTVLGSARSFEEGRKYAEFELDRFDTRKRQQHESTNQDHHEFDEGEQTQDEGNDPLVPRHSDIHTSMNGHNATGTSKQKDPPVAWSDLPRKGQLTILTLARLSEPLTQTSLQSYMFYQLKSFELSDGSSPSDSTVARQAGILAAAFTGAQFCTAILWGRAADSEVFGRKRVILIGLLGTAVGSLGFGFSSSFASAVFWRAAGGMLNGNIGVMRTMISEIIVEKKFQSRAFLLLPMCFNIGVIVGPLIGGLLADPVGRYPGVFGKDGLVGGEQGVVWMRRWPYALPNVVNACFLGMSALLVVFGLEETLEGLRGRSDWGVGFQRWIGRTIFRVGSRGGYTPIPSQWIQTRDDVEMGTSRKQEIDHKPKTRRKLPFREIWTRNVTLTLLSNALLALHVATFNNLWFVFLSTPRYNQNQQNASNSSTTPASNLENLPQNYEPDLPFIFTGGLALPPPQIGTALSILGVTGITLQLLLYPPLSHRLGTTKSLRYSLLLFPIAYTLTPYLSLLPSSTAPPEPKSGPWIWIGITFILAIQVLARTFALPAAAILTNNSAPHPSMLGTLHGVAQSVSSGARTLGPVLAGWAYGAGLRQGIVGAAWWGMGAVAILGAVAGRFVHEGSGLEIEMEEEEDGEEQLEGRKG